MARPAALTMKSMGNTTGLGPGAGVDARCRFPVTLSAQSDPETPSPTPSLLPFAEPIASQSRESTATRHRRPSSNVSPRLHRRGGRAVECAGLENRYGRFRPSRVRIPPSPFRGPCRLLNEAACLTRMVDAGRVGSARANASQQRSMGSFLWTFAQATVSCVGIRMLRPRVPRPVRSHKPGSTWVNASRAVMDGVPSQLATSVGSGAPLLANSRCAAPRRSRPAFVLARSCDLKGRYDIPRPGDRSRAVTPVRPMATATGSARDSAPAPRSARASV